MKTLNTNVVNTTLSINDLMDNNYVVNQELLELVAHAIRPSRVGKEKFAELYPLREAGLDQHDVLRKLVAKHGQEIVLHAMRERYQLENSLIEIDGLDFDKMAQESAEDFEVANDNSMSIEELQVVYKLNNGVRIINACGKLKVIGVDNPIGEQLRNAAVTMIHGWDATDVKQTAKNPDGLNYGRRILKAFQSKASEKVTKVYIYSFGYIKGLRTPDFVGPMRKPLVDVQFTSRGITCNLHKGSVKLADGTVVKINSGIRRTVNSTVLKEGLVSMLERVNIHEEESVLVEYDTTILKMKDVPVDFGKELMFKLLLLVNNGINLDPLFKNKDAILVLKLKLGTTALEVVKCPAYEMKEVYGNTGLTTTTEAKAGLVAPKKELAGMIRYNDEGCAMKETANKLSARYDKNESKTDGWLIRASMLLVNDASTEVFKPMVLTPCVDAVDGAMYQGIKRWLSTGAMWLPDATLLKVGHFRGTSNLQNGWIKAACGPVSAIDTRLNDAGVGLISASSFKGGLASAYFLQVGKDPLLVTASMAKALESNLTKGWKTYTISGVSVQAQLIDVEIRITNAYTAESVMSNVDRTKTTNRLQDSLLLVETEANRTDGTMTPSGFRDDIMDKVMTSDLAIGSWMTHALAMEDIKWKPTVTRVIASELQTVAYHHGHKHAIAWLKSLVNNRLNRDDSSKQLFVELTRGVKASQVVNRVSIHELLNAYSSGMALAQQDPRSKSVMLPLNVLKTLVNKMCGFGHERGWVEVDFGFGAKVMIPATAHLYGGLADAAEHKSSALTEGLLADLVSVMQDLIREDGEFFNTQPERVKFAACIKAKVQKALCGKGSGRLMTVGGYFTVLPCPNLARGEVVLPGRDLYLKDEDKGMKAVRANITKMPAFFFQATAGCLVLKDLPGYTFTEEMRNVLSCVVFMNPEDILEMQNDADGDQYRVTFYEHVLPRYGSNGGVAGRFNAKFHAAHVNEETNNNRLKAKPMHTYTMRQLHTKIYEAVNAKDLVGMFTATKYFYEFGMSFVDTFTGVNGIEYRMTEDDKLNVSLLLGELIQVEAMNNMKQEGSDSYVMECIAHRNFSHVYCFGIETEEEALGRLTRKAVAQLLNYLTQKDSNGEDLYVMNNLSVWCTKVVMFLAHVARTVQGYKEGFDLFNDRIMENNVIAVMSGTTEKAKDFDGLSSSILDAIADTKHISMYHHLFVQLNKVYDKQEAKRNSLV